MKYETTFTLPRDLTLGAVEYVVEKLRERAFPTLVFDKYTGMPSYVHVVFELTEDQDGWDLHDVVNELNDELEAYIGSINEMPRPTLVKEN